MRRYDWAKLNHMQLGRFAEYFVKMELTLHGWDTYTPEVDDRGIDFVIRSDGGAHFDIQVKSCRGLNYIFLPKDKFTIRPNMLAAVVLFVADQSPDVFLIPSTRWLSGDPVFVTRDYEGLKSKPEWGINISQKNLPALDSFRIDRTLACLEME